MQKIAKFSMFFKTVKIVKNWQDVLAVYKGQKKESLSIFKLKNGQKIKLRANSTDIHVFANVWLIEEYKRKGFEIKDHDLIIDIGAHIGLFTIYAAQFCKHGKIFSFEPIKENFDLLKENIELNNLKNIEYFNLAVLDREDQIKIFKSNDQSAYSIYKIGTDYQMTNIMSLQKIFDDNKITRCDLLKLDCEGSEYQILMSLPESYFQRIEKICMEYHIINNNSESLESLKTKLVSLGYKLELLPTSSNLGMFFAKR